MPEIGDEPKNGAAQNACNDAGGCFDFCVSVCFLDTGGEQMEIDKELIDKLLDRV